MRQPDQLDKQKRMWAAWQEATQQVEWDVRAGVGLILFLLPSAAPYLHDTARQQTGLQGVGERRYWDRVINDHMDSAQVPDQTVLRDIAAWRNRPSADSALVVGMCGSAEYCGRWTAFAFWQFGQDTIALLTLAGHILEHCRSPAGVRIVVPDDFGSHLPNDAFSAIWNHAKKTLQADRRTCEWVQQQILLAMPVSLSLVNDLYYWWVNNAQFVRIEDRDAIRTLILLLAKEHYTTGAELLRVLHPVRWYAIYQLIFPADQDVPPSVLRDVTDWAWLTPVMLEALRTGSPAMACEVAALISEQQDMSHGGITRQLLQVRFVSFFGAQTPEVISLLADARYRVTGHYQAMLDQVVMAARVQTMEVPK